jgi:hypothetical protein
MQSAGSAREYVTNGQPPPDPDFTYRTFHLQRGAATLYPLSHEVLTRAARGMF